ncbi:matrix-remodeling-associated protein 7 [Amazona aestiva]|uniref:Matrix-remodeling-associated protein 7 n=1 Tax=Amazona aestiva TaxID=12930 RepID=A0A0Q3PKT6_AMAAE|nr:matrix-remodeling-associated protein 7 [Amazona aestiva]
MVVAVDFYLSSRLLFTILALVLAFVFMRLWGAEGEQPWELLMAKPARENGPRDQEARKEQLPVEEVGAAKEGKKVAAEQLGEMAEEPSPAAEPSPVVAESIPQQPPAEHHKPEPQEDAGDHATLPSKADEEDLDSDKEEAGGERAGKHSSYTSPSDKYSSDI